MNKGKIFAIVTAITTLLACWTAYAAVPSDLKIGITKPGAQLTVDRVIADGKVLVSVDDAQKKPLLGLGIEDFTVTQGKKEGRVVSVQSVAEVQDVPLTIVMVLDNSYSMYERKAIKALLDGFDKVLKVVRPSDKVQLVVFDNKLTTTVGGQNLHVQTFASSSPDELRAFAKKAYSQEKLTASTYLNDGVMAGVDLIAKAPAENPRILVIFSDGEDINSVVKREEVVQAANNAGKFSAYAIDYMPGPSLNEYLTKFVDAHHGKIWKAASEENLVPIFEEVATTMDYSYILTYVFTPKPILMVFPEAALFDFDKAELKPEGKEQINAYREKTKEQLSRADKIKISGHTDNVGTADYNMKLSQQRAEAVSVYLKSIGVDPAKIEAAGEGLTRPIADNRTKEGRARNRRVEVEVLGLEK
jgi:outer membrane protein OmpA-like peptidoglycan-associated protein